jgi:biofilm PGA synthesis N-glycosyltransferase PgaC
MNSTSPGKSVRYVVVSPVRNEEQYLERTIQSLIEQTIKPVQWIVVDDGSTDRTAEIVKRWASAYSWIVLVQRSQQDRCSGSVSQPLEGTRKRGQRAHQAKEIEAFHEGYQRLTHTDWDFIVKLDGDLGFEPDYFEKCFTEFTRDSTLGIGGGVICNLVDGELILEPTPRFHVRGATKIYSRACWEQIGGVIRGAAWDTIDEVKANMLGWTTRSFDDLRVVHYRFTGAANGLWRNAVKNGAWSYIAGYHPLFLISRCVRRVFEKPYILGSIGLLYGFLTAYLGRASQIDDKQTMQYLRAQQLRRLFFLPSVWK